MNLATLPAGTLEMLGNGLRHATMLVGNDEADSFQTTPLEPTEGFFPGGEALGVADPDTQYFPVAIAADAREDQCRALYHPVILTTLQKQRIDQQKRIFALQPSLVERPDPVSRPAHSALTVDFEKLAPHNSSVIAATFRVETPCTTIFLQTIRHGKALAVLRGFGGCARDIAIALGLMPITEAVPTRPRPDEEGYRSGLIEIARAHGRYEITASTHLSLLQSLACADSLTDATEALIRYLLRAPEAGKRSQEDESLRRSTP